MSNLQHYVRSFGTRTDVLCYGYLDIIRRLDFMVINGGAGVWISLLNVNLSDCRVGRPPNRIALRSWRLCRPAEVQAGKSSTQPVCRRGYCLLTSSEAVALYIAVECWRAMLLGLAWGIPTQSVIHWGWFVATLNLNGKACNSTYLPAVRVLYPQLWG